jgi:3-hydroxyacyl-[acyl-carrier-protein] dehydratase
MVNEVAGGVPFLDVRKIMEFLPHRYPFLLIDRVLELVKGNYVTALKNVTINEPFFQGHFPGLPVMPGVLQLEALAQSAGMYIMNTFEGKFEGKVFVFTGMEKIKFRKPVVPGDQLILRCENFRQKLNLFKMSGKGTVDGKVTVEGEMTAALIAREDL